MCNGLETLVISTYDVMSYVIWGIPTLPCSVVVEGSSWKRYFSVLKKSIHGMESQFVFLPSQNIVEVVVPHSSRLLLSVQILEELEDVGTSVSPFGLETLRQFHVKFILDGRVGVRLDEVYLSGVPLFDGGHI